MIRRILSLILLTFVIASAFVILSTRYSKSEASFPTEEKRMKVLRRKGQLKLKPTAREMASFKKIIQEEKEEKRELDDQVPKHLPIKIRIKADKEKLFKDLKNENWARDFELEVTNTGIKPIYYLALQLNTDVIAAGGYHVGFTLSFGRVELSDIRVKAEPNGLAIKPGETYVFKIHPSELEGYSIRQREEKRPHPKKLSAIFQLMSFGDGTGYAGSDGLALPRKLNRTSLDKCKDRSNRGSPGPIEWTAMGDKWPSKLLLQDLPVGFLPVNFLPLNFNHLSFLSPPSDLCCPSYNCASLIPRELVVCLNCPPQQRPTTTYCEDEFGACWSSFFSSRECRNDNGTAFTCQVITLHPCGAGSPPSPTPSPSPSPSPSPTPQECDPDTRPNGTNCVCSEFPGIGPLWQCLCLTGDSADYVRYSQSGGCDPTKSVNNGNDCCECIAQGVNCGPDSTWSIRSCECIPNPTPTPTPTGGGGDPIYYSSCTQYYWVWYVSYDGGQTWWETGFMEFAGCW